MKLLNKGVLDTLIHNEPLSEGTNRFIEVEFEILMGGVKNLIDTDVMIVLDGEDNVIELCFDMVYDVYTEDQEDGIKNLLETAYNGI